jgi:hypothetical protein
MYKATGQQRGNKKTAKEKRLEGFSKTLLILGF